MLDNLEFNYKAIIFIVIGTAIIAFLINLSFNRLITKYQYTQNSKLTTYQFLRRFVLVTVYLIGICFAVYQIEPLRSIASSGLAGAGILAVAVGFASQAALSNVISGIFIIIFRPFQINDRLLLRETMVGVVEDITLRHVVIRNFENQRIIIPNTVISEEIIINPDYISDKICKYIDFSISFDSDIDTAKIIMAEEVEAHPLFVDVRSEMDIKSGIPLVTVRVVSIGEYAVKLRAWAWARNSPEGFLLSCDLLESIKKRFDKSDKVEIPYPYRNIVEKANHIK